LATVLQMLIRIGGLLLLLLGALFWSGHALSLVSLHMLVGLLFVLCLWGLAGVGLRAGAPLGLAALVAGWGALVVALGLTQDSLLPGSSHWVVRLVHLLVGITAIGLAEVLGGRIRRQASPTN
jgi:hypothetical protein